MKQYYDVNDKFEAGVKEDYIQNTTNFCIHKCMVQCIDIQYYELSLTIYLIIIKQGKEKWFV